MRVVIDRRPIWFILLTRGLRPAFFLALGLLFWYLNHLPTPEGLTIQGQRAIAIFVVALALWITNALPLAITSLLAIVMIPFLGILEGKEAYALFGNEAVFFILGAFILAGAVMYSGLSKRIALAIMERFGGTPRGLLVSIFLLASTLSFFMSEHAVAAMLFPIVLEIAKGLNLRPGRSNYGRLLFLGLAWGCIIGGVATFLGGARVPLAAGILKETTGITLGFFEYTVAVLPVVLVMLLIGYGVLVKVFPIDVTEVEEAKTLLAKRLQDMGKIGYNEYAVGAIMVITILLWVFWGWRFGIANIALISVTILFLFRLVRWKDIEEYVNWGIILMYGGAITLGAALDRTGTAQWIMDSTIGDWMTSPMVLVAVLSLVSLLLTEGMSNAAVIAVLMPVGVGLSGRFDVDPKALTYAIAVPAGLAFCLPMSTPANAIAVSSNYIRVKDMALSGVFMGIISWLAFNIVARFYWPLLGIDL